MKKIEFTERQKDAINAPVADILVSAAAGSGKTAVLTQRIIKNLLDSDSGIGIKDMLVVTFTKAAASELKMKISNAVAQTFAADPTNKFLRKQLVEVENANISTIHSFCADLIKEHSEELGLPLSMKITDTAQIKLLYKSVMEEVISEGYSNDTAEFNAFAENFVALRDGALSDTLEAMYEKLLSYPEGVEYLSISEAKLREIEEKGFDNSVYAHEIVMQFKNLAKFCVSLVDVCLDFAKSNEDYSHLTDTFSCDKAWFEKLSSLKDGGYYECAELVRSYKFKTAASTPRSMQNEEFLEIAALRNKYKKLFSDFVSKYFSHTAESIKDSAGKSADFCHRLYLTLKEFDKRICEEKIAGNMLDYNDLERYAHKLLCKDGRPTEYARKIAKRYKQIYIDEYQDISPVQDQIFTSIGSSNIFMVGDIKQSIYGFRGSAPDLFASYREKYPDYDKNTCQNSLKIFLIENFRCDSSVIGFSNMVFEGLFRHDLAEVPYLKEDALVCRKKEEEDKHQKVTVAIVEYDDNTEKEYAEARYVASEIKRLISQGVKAKEIAIMMRKSKNVASYYKKALEEQEIKYVSDAKEELFDRAEVMLIVSMLEVIDNSGNDIALSAVLKSPVFAFSADELATLAFERHTTMLGALKKHIEEKEDDISVKGRAFLSWLGRCREKAKESPSHEVIRYIYSDLSMYALVKACSEDKNQAVENLGRIYQLALDYESASFKGLGSFVRHLERMRSEKIAAETAEPSALDDDKVNLITIHHSKGLEYEVCFVCDLARSVNNPDAKEELLADRDMGVSLKLRDKSGYIKYDTPMRLAGALHITRKVMEEEMRVLYVALTRAKNKLYLTASAKDADKLIESSKLIPGKNRCYYGYVLSKQFIKWVLSSCTDDPCYEIVKISPNSVTDDIRGKEGSDAERKDQSYSCEILEKVKKAVDFRYGDTHAPCLPAKIAVSALYPSLLDEDEDPMNTELKDAPDFMKDGKKATPAQKGSATHLFMQFCDFDRVDKYGVENELEVLVKDKYITKDSAELVYMDKVKAFFASDLYKQMRGSSELYREYRFNVLISSSEFTIDKREEYGKSQVLVQGVIDCFFALENGNYKVIDYKTDRAYGDDPEAKIADEYKYQLTYYKKAIEQITGRAVSSTTIYSFDLEKEIEIKV